MNKQEQLNDATQPEMTPEMEKMVAAAVAKALAEKVAAPAKPSTPDETPTPATPATPSVTAETPEPSPAPAGGPATQPPPAMGIPGKWGMGSAFKACMKRYTKFNGRASRSEFWYLALANFIIVSTLEVLMTLACVACFYGGVGTVIPMALFMVIIMLYNLFMTVPGLALCVRRLHDTGKAWTYLLMYLIPIAGPIILLIALCSPSGPANRFGEAPDMLPGDDEQMPSFVDKLAAPLRNPVKTAQISGIAAAALAVLGALYFFIFVRTNPMKELYKEGKLAQLDNDWNSPEPEQEFNKHVRAYLDKEADITTHPYIANLLAISIQKDFTVPVEIIEELVDRGADLNAKSTLLSESESPWVQAVIKGDVAILDYLAAAGAQKDETDSAGKPVLMRAIEKGDAEMLRALVRHGMNPNATVKQGSIIMYAIVQNKPDMVQLLMELGADINSNAAGGTALDCAYVSNSPESVEILRKANGATTPDILIDTLYKSIRRNNDSQLKLLLGAGLPLNDGSASHDNYTPLMLAADRGNEEAIKLLLEAGADPKATTKDAQGNEQTALTIAAGKSNLNVRALLGDEKAVIMLELLKDTKLMSIDEAMEMLEECEIIDEFASGKAKTDWMGNTTYDTTQRDISEKFKYNYKLCKDGHKKFSDFGFILDIYRCYACDTKKHLPMDAIKSLIAAGASLSWHVNNEYALDYASFYGHTDIVKMMLAAGANAGYGSPLEDAVKKNHTEIVKLLLAAPGIDVNAGNPLSVAVRNQNAEIVKLLLAAPGIKVNNILLNTAIEKGNIEIVKSLLAYPGINVNVKASDGEFPLYYAALKSNADIVKLLLEKPEINVNLSYLGEYGTALLRAIRSSGNKSSLEVIQLLLSHPGIDVNQSTASHYNAPLALAADQGDIEIVKLLLAAPGIDVNKNAPIMKAASGNHKEIAELLLDNPNTYLDAQMLRDLGYGHEIAMMYSGNDTIRLIGERYKTRKCPPKKATVTNVSNTTTTQNATISAEAFEKLTPLYDRLARLKCKEAYSALCQKRLLMLLDRIREGGDINMTTEETKGSAAIHYACSLGSLSITTWLLENGADPNLKTAKGADPITCVGSDNRKAIINLLKKHGARSGK